MKKSLMNSNTTLVSINPLLKKRHFGDCQNSNTTIVSINQYLHGVVKFSSLDSNTTIVSINRKAYTGLTLQKQQFKYNYCFY